MLYKALEWNCPQFGHVPLIMGVDKKRLSKRHGATSVEDFKNQGILADALFNYLCLLGWSPGDDSEIMDRNEIIEKFDQSRINKSAAIFDPKKLNWYNSKYIAQVSVKDIMPGILEHCKRHNWKLEETEKKRFELYVELCKTRSTTLSEINDSMEIYFVDPKSYAEKGINKLFTNGTSVAVLKKLLEKIKAMVDNPFEEIDSAEKFIRGFAESENIAAAKIIHPLRLTITGRMESPGIFELVYILGKDKIIRRVNNALAFCRKLDK